MPTEIELRDDAADREERKETARLMGKAQEGDAKALAKLSEAYVQKHAFWLQLGDFGGMVERHLLQAQLGENLLLREGMVRRLAEMRRELAGASPTPLEQLLAERVALCWLRLHGAELTATRSGISFQQAEYDQKALDRAHKRYLSALKTLATVRRLEVPPMQVNIAEKQVNVAGG